MPEILTDEQLMEQVKQGDLQKSSLLFDRYNKHLYNFFVKISYDRELSQDLTQNVFLRMIKFSHTYKSTGKFKSWIFQIARNVYADHYRSNKLTNVKDVERIGSNEEAIDVRWARDEQEKLLYIALYRLSIEHREVLLLSKFQKMKYQEIAEIYDTTIGAIKAKVHRAMGKLQEHYFKLEKV